MQQTLIEHLAYGGPVLGAGATLVKRQGTSALLLTSQFLHAVENGFKPAQVEWVSE